MRATRCTPLAEPWASGLWFVVCGCAGAALLQSQLGRSGPHTRNFESGWLARRACVQTRLDRWSARSAAATVVVVAVGRVCVRECVWK
jgi:hypothetical protein